MTLIALSRVNKLIHLLLCPISLEKLQKFNTPNSLPIIRDNYAEPTLKFDTTKKRFLYCGDKIQNVFFNSICRTAMRVHFVHRHVQDTVVILEEGNLPHPLCPRCNLQVPRKALNGRHLGTAQCKKGAERKRRRLAKTETQENSEREFHAYGKPMEAVSDSNPSGGF